MSAFGKTVSGMERTQGWRCTLASRAETHESTSSLHAHLTQLEGAGMASGRKGYTAFTARSRAPRKSACLVRHRAAADSARADRGHEHERIRPISRGESRSDYEREIGLEYFREQSLGNGVGAGVAIHATGPRRNAGRRRQSARALDATQGREERPWPQRTPQPFAPRYPGPSKSICSVRRRSAAQNARADRVREHERIRHPSKGRVVQSANATSDRHTSVGRVLGMG